MKIVFSHFIEKFNDTFNFINRLFFNQINVMVYIVNGTNGLLIIAKLCFSVIA